VAIALICKVLCLCIVDYGGVRREGEVEFIRLSGVIFLNLRISSPEVEAGLGLKLRLDLKFNLRTYLPLMCLTL
jgi:hypothetical protein